MPFDIKFGCWDSSIYRTFYWSLRDGNNIIEIGFNQMQKTIRSITLVSYNDTVKPDTISITESSHIQGLPSVALHNESRDHYVIEQGLIKIYINRQHHSIDVFFTESTKLMNVTCIRNENVLFYVLNNQLIGIGIKHVDDVDMETFLESTS